MLTSAAGGEKENIFVFFFIFATSGASEHFQTPLQIYFELARRVLSDENKL